MIVFSILTASSLVYAGAIHDCPFAVPSTSTTATATQKAGTGTIGTNSCALCDGNDGDECLASEVTTAATPVCRGTCYDGICHKSCVGGQLLDCDACLSSTGSQLSNTPCVGGIIGDMFLGKCKESRCVIACADPSKCDQCLNRHIDAECKIPSYSRLGRCQQSITAQGSSVGVCSFVCPDTANGHCPELCASIRFGLPCSYQNNGRTLPGLCSRDGYCVANCQQVALGTIFDTTGDTVCSTCDSGRKCMGRNNFVGMCAQGKCVVDCSMQTKPGDHGRCYGSNQYTGCNNANFGSYCVTAQGQELGVCDDSIRLGNGGRHNTCVVACKDTRISTSASQDYKCHTCAADGSRCYTGDYHGRYDASRAVCVMDCNPQTCQTSNSNCNTACQSCSTNSGCYSTTSLNANTKAVIEEEEEQEEAEAKDETKVTSTPAQTKSKPATQTASGGCSSNQNCRAHEVCDGSVCVCDDNYEKKGSKCVKVSDTILGVNKTVFAIVLPIVLLLVFGLLAAFCLFRSKSGQDESSDRGMRGGKKRFDSAGNYTSAQRLAPRKEKNSEISARGVE